MYLITTSLEYFHRLEEKALLLGPWCLNIKEKQIASGHIYIPSPWQPATKIKEAADYCYEVYERLLQQLSDNLNAIHGVNYPLKYWKILLGPWLLHFIGIFYDRYKRMEKALELFPDFYTHVLADKDCSLVTFDTCDFLAVKADEDYYNLKLFSLVAHDLCPNNIKIKDYNAEFKMNSLRNNWKIKLFYKLIKPLDYFSKVNMVMSDMYPLNLPNMSLLKYKLKFKTYDFADSLFSRKSYFVNNYSSELRKNIRLKLYSDKFESLLCRLIPDAMPMCYLENYSIYQKMISNTKKSSPPRIVGSSVGWYFTEKFKFFAADAVAKGAKTIDFQHGGGYGFSQAIPNEALSLEKDIFYVWGWNSKDHDKVRPLPSPHLSAIKDSYSPRLDRLLFISTMLPRYHYRFHSDLFPEDIPKYFLDKRIFLSKLNKAIRGRLLYRPYFYDYGWKEEISLKGVFPDIKFMPKGRLVDWMKKVKLVVIDHPHTSFLEALTINVPSIFYWDHSVYLMRDDAEGYFEKLRKAGILYKDPDNAAEKVNEVCSDPMKWWLSRDIQQARQDFCNRYAYTSKDWLNIWTKELSGLL